MKEDMIGAQTQTEMEGEAALDVLTMATEGAQAPLQQGRALRVMPVMGRSRSARLSMSPSYSAILPPTRVQAPPDGQMTTAEMRVRSEKVRPKRLE